MVKIGQKVTIGDTMGFARRFEGANEDIKRGDVLYVQNFICKGGVCQYDTYIYNEPSYETYLDSEIAIMVVRNPKDTGQYIGANTGVWIPYIITTDYQLSVNNVTMDIRPIKKEARSW